MGAGLPVIATLKHLIDTGDKIVKVQRSLNPEPLQPCTSRLGLLTTPALLRPPCPVHTYVAASADA